LCALRAHSDWNPFQLNWDARRTPANSHCIVPVSHRSGLSILLVLLVTRSLGCTRLDANVSRPPEFVGWWARLVADTSWIDTIELRPDGSVRSRDNTVSDSVSWAVVHSRVGEGFCLGSRHQPNCRDFRLEGDTLVLISPTSHSYWRRAR